VDSWQLLALNILHLLELKNDEHNISEVKRRMSSFNKSLIARFHFDLMNCLGEEEGFFVGC
jgi:hypothetical protein